MAANCVWPFQMLDYREEQLLCIQSCRDSSNRLCQQPPKTCGDCLPQYEDREGVCKAPGEVPGHLWFVHLWCFDLVKLKDFIKCKDR